MGVSGRARVRVRLGLTVVRVRFALLNWKS